MMDENTRRMRSLSHTLKPRIIIGKNGFTEQVIKDIVKELKNHELVKIKILNTYIGNKDKKEVVSEIVKETNSRLIDFIGFTLTLSRR
jgi:RNA-binding protein